MPFARRWRTSQAAASDVPTRPTARCHARLRVPLPLPVGHERRTTAGCAAQGRSAEANRRSCRVGRPASAQPLARRASVHGRCDSVPGAVSAPAIPAPRDARAATEAGRRRRRGGRPAPRHQRVSARCRSASPHGRRHLRPANSRMQGSRICPPLPASQGAVPRAPLRADSEHARCPSLAGFQLAVRPDARSGDEVELAAVRRKRLSRASDPRCPQCRSSSHLGRCG